MNDTKDMVKVVQEHGDMLAKCCLKHPSESWYPGIVKKVIAWWDSTGEYAGGTDREGIVLFKTDKGTYGILQDGEDYTGHGCQCQSSFEIWDSWSKLVNIGLTEEERNKLNVEVVKCPDDTDGDGNCGKVACPFCGKYKDQYKKGKLDIDFICTFLVKIQNEGDVHSNHIATQALDYIRENR